MAFRGGPALLARLPRPARAHGLSRRSVRLTSVRREPSRSPTHSGRSVWPSIWRIADLADVRPVVVRDDCLGAEERDHGPGRAAASRDRPSSGLEKRSAASTTRCQAACISASDGSSPAGRSRRVEVGSTEAPAPAEPDGARATPVATIHEIEFIGSSRTASSSTGRQAALPLGTREPQLFDARVAMAAGRPPTYHRACKESPCPARPTCPATSSASSTRSRTRSARRRRPTGSRRSRATGADDEPRRQRPGRGRRPRDPDRDRRGPRPPGPGRARPTASTGCTPS